jgi:hypothetical protein
MSHTHSRAPPIYSFRSIISERIILRPRCPSIKRTYELNKNRLKILLALTMAPPYFFPRMSNTTPQTTGAGNSAAHYHARTTRETIVRIQAQFWDSKTEFIVPAGTPVKLDLCAVDISQGRIQTRYCYKGNCIPLRVMGQTAPYTSDGCAARGSFFVADLELI